MQKRRLGPCVTFFPQPATLIATRDSAGVANLMMASWVGIVSKTPPTIGVSLHHGRQTYVNIKASGGFSVNVVPAELAVAADLCGVASGRRVDKLAATGLQLEAGVHDDLPLVVESPLNLECRYRDEMILGEYRLVFGEIVEIHARDAAFDAAGNADIRQFDPLVYLGGLREYWSLGAKVADAYQAGLALLPKAGE
ncbi:MAG: flavin reductase family protein [Desulfuromonadales bacterium]|nr:flavin reductase family protein [Desulfuromonadales bacterium]